METLMKILIGVLITVVAGLILIYLKRSRLKIKASPHKRWLIEDLYSPNINIKITNLGFEKTEVDDIQLVLKNGSDQKLIKNDIWHKTLLSVEAKSTKTTLINCSEAIKTLDFKDFKIAKLKVFTTNGKVYSSNWISMQDILDCWK